MSHYEAIAAWIGINIVIAILGPLIVGKAVAVFLNPQPSITIRRFYSKGELGLASLATGLSVVLDTVKSPTHVSFASEAITILVGACLFGAWAWVMGQIFDILGNKNVDWEKIWRYSWRSALLVFSVGLTVEVLLELASS